MAFHFHPKVARCSLVLRGHGQDKEAACSRVAPVRRFQRIATRMDSRESLRQKHGLSLLLVYFDTFCFFQVFSSLFATPHKTPRWNHVQSLESISTRIRRRSEHKLSIREKGWECRTDFVGPLKLQARRVKDT